MSADIDNGPCKLPVLAPAPSRLALLLKALRRRWQAYRRRLATARQLDQLNDHILCDIGLDRNEIRMARYRVADWSRVPKR
jgi:uncharacterized protein YjiS (DUF1127 family)